MKFRIIGDAPAAALLTGLLAAEKQEVIWNPDIEGDERLKKLKQRREIRLILPGGWVRSENFGLSASARLKAGETGVVAIGDPGRLARADSASAGRIGSAGRTLLLLDCREEERKRIVNPGATVIRGLSLLEATEWDTGVVEVPAPRPRLMVETGPELQELKNCLKACLSTPLQTPRRVRLKQREPGIEEVEDLPACRNALDLWKLLSLPLALCHSTLGVFLSYEEGRQIALRVLQEGFSLLSHLEMPVARLPVMDPQELLQRLQRRPGEFDAGRNKPDRRFGTALGCLLRGQEKAARAPNDRIVRLSSQTGIDPTWNWALTQKVSRVRRTGFFRDPIELYNAIS